MASCELIELSAGSVQNQSIEKISIDEWDRPHCPRLQGLYEFYNVMWIKRKEGVGYRKAVGRVVKRVWEEIATESIPLILG